jgi:hypothetical protein
MSSTSGPIPAPQPTSGPAPEEPLLDALSAAVDGLVGLELWRLGSAGLTRLVDALEVQTRRIAAVSLDAISDAESRGVTAASGRPRPGRGCAIAPAPAQRSPPVRAPPPPCSPRRLPSNRHRRRRHLASPDPRSVGPSRRRARPAPTPPTPRSHRPHPALARAQSRTPALKVNAAATKASEQSEQSKQPARDR